MQNIVVTGATGFVGLNIMRSLQSMEIPVIPVVRTGKEHLVSGYNNISRIITTSDLFKESAHWWNRVFEDCEIIIHAAWYTNPFDYLNSPRNYECLSGTITMARSASISGVKRVVGLGTCFEYDTKFGYLSTSTPLKPESLYAASKSSVFTELTQLFDGVNIGFAWCRLFYLFGTGEHENRLYSHIHSRLKEKFEVRLTSGDQIRDFLPVEEAAEEIVRIALSSKSGAFNVCSGSPVTVREFAERIADEYGRRDLLKFNTRDFNYTDPEVIVGVKNT